MNQIFTIKPYRWNGVWVFDDPERNLHREALVAGVPELIEWGTRKAGISDPDLGFVVLFSKDEFPSAMMRLDWVSGDEAGGNTYAMGERKGWLCPALLKYFDDPPPAIHLELRSLDVELVGFDEWFRSQLRTLPGLAARLNITRNNETDAILHSWALALAKNAWDQGRRAGARTGET